MKILILAAALGTGLFASGLAYAGDTMPPAASSAAMTAKPDKAATAARSQECSKEADAQGLKGHTRKVFREKCKRGAK